jgi:putative transposase
LLYRRGVRKLYIGYPIMLSQNNGNKYNTNIWWFRKIVLWIVDIFMEYGIEVEIFPEDYTSGEYSICGNKHKNGRIYRGLYECKKTGRKINADINAALNIARRLGYMIRIARKIESYLVTHNGVKPLIPLQRANTRDPSIETPPLKGGEGVIENSAFTMGNKVSKLPYLSPSLGFRVSDLLSRLQVVILIVIPFRRIIGPPIYSGLHLSFGGQSGWSELPQEPIILGSKD